MLIIEEILARNIPVGCTCLECSRLREMGLLDEKGITDKGIEFYEAEAVMRTLRKL
jgi:hypothetical protein